MSRRLGVAIVLLAALVCTGCPSSSTPPQPEDGRLKIVATTGPVGDLVQNIVGDLAAIDVMMGPGVDPHLYREAPADILKLDAADVIFYNGLHLEGGIGDTLDRLGARKAIFAVTTGLEESHDPRLLTPPGFAGHADPHVWHDPMLWSECAQYVADRMGEVDPAGRDAYQRAATDYIAKLTALDQECREALAAIPEERRVLITAHDAFAYFSKTYGLEAVGLKGISTEDEVDLTHMADVQRLIIDRKVPCVFVESAVAPQIMEALVEPCREKGHKVFVPQDQSQQLYADALGKPGTEAGAYIGMIRANVKTIVAGLKGELK